MSAAYFSNDMKIWRFAVVVYPVMTSDYNTT